jgi:hypothetical protein
MLISVVFQTYHELTQYSIAILKLAKCPFSVCYSPYENVELNVVIIKYLKSCPSNSFLS